MNVVILYSDMQMHLEHNYHWIHTNYTDILYITNENLWNIIQQVYYNGDE